MTAEGVMVSYNHSEEDKGNIITVSASGLMFSNRWVLTHGSILSPLKQVETVTKSRGKPILNEEFYDNLPEIYVTCEVGSTYDNYEAVAAMARERDEHASYRVRILTGRICHVWQCPVLGRCVEDILYSWTIGHRDGDSSTQTQLGKELLSVFVLVDLETADRSLKPLRPLSELYDQVRPPPDRGADIEIISTPFGNEVFLNTVTRGSVCGLVGKTPALLLSDASTALGSEGGPIFSTGESGGGGLVGMVACCVSWWRGEWVGLTLCAPLHAALQHKLRLHPPAAGPPRPRPPSSLRRVLECIDGSAVLVRCGAAWGAGVYLGRGYFATCAHVVKHYSTSKISIYCQGVKETAIVRYKTADEKAYDLALLFSNPEYWDHLTKAEFAKELPSKGEPVLAAGYPYFNENNIEDLRPTVTKGHVNNVSPSMLQTSCCVQSGFSGGAIYRIKAPSSVEVLGLIVCNAKTDTGACYPYINMAVPAPVFTKLFETFMLDKDMGSLNTIEDKKEMIQSQWRLLPYRSKI